MGSQYLNANGFQFTTCDYAIIVASTGIVIAKSGKYPWLNSVSIFTTVQCIMIFSNALMAEHQPKSSVKYAVDQYCICSLIIIICSL